MDLSTIVAITYMTNQNKESILKNGQTKTIL